MIYLTQIMYVHAGREATFEAFEAVVLPLLAKYRGELVLRLRGDKLAGSAEAPHEVHIIRFDADEDLARYSNDPDRQRVLSLRNEAVQHSMLIKGTLV
jgi:antibiotic biosynthesis monooxygenase (ABM) superfamily enzyme